MWLYYRFSLSFRDLEDLLTQRGIIVSYETIRQWCEKFGSDYAASGSVFGAASIRMEISIWSTVTAGWLG